MTIKIDDRTILALEIRRSCFGYAVFQGPKRLLDWGSTSPSPLDGAGERAKYRFLSLLNVFVPTVVVVKKARKGTPRNAILQFIKREASQRSIPLLVITQNEVHKWFCIFQARNKYEIAEVLTRIFPELLFKIPRKRRVWESEAHAMIVFDAIATGFAFWQQKRSEDLPPG